MPYLINFVGLIFPTRSRRGQRSYPAGRSHPTAAIRGNGPSGAGQAKLLFPAARKVPGEPGAYDGSNPVMSIRPGTARVFLGGDPVQVGIEIEIFLDGQIVIEPKLLAVM